MTINVKSRINPRATTTTHGTQSAYKNGCRCKPCTEAARRAGVAYRLHQMRTGARTTNAVGTRRRILALGVIGWPYHRIAAEAGVTTRTVQRLGSGVVGTVNVDTAAAIRNAYDALSMTPAPAGKTKPDKCGRALVVRAARLKGGVPPLAWDDDTIDDPDSAPHAETEKRHGGRRIHVEDIEFILTHNPLATTNELAERFGVTRSAVQHALDPDRGNRPDLLARLARNAEMSAA